MDAFAITGVSPEHDWFRVQAAVGGVEAPARLFPRVHVVSSADIADLASGGRTIYFQQGGSERPLVPLASDDATSFDPCQVPLEEIPEFAFTETATDADVEALLCLRNGDEPDGNTLDLLDRLEGLGWVLQDPDGTVALTTIGRELLRHRLA
jgi:hypothetical protein